MKEKLFSINKSDFTIQTFRSGGKGGQHQNKTDSGVRIIHNASGARGESRNYASQYQNRKAALARLTSSKEFTLWLQQRVWEITRKKTVKKQVEEDMHPKNLKVETKDDNGRWTAEYYNEHLGEFHSQFFNEGFQNYVERKHLVGCPYDIVKERFKYFEWQKGHRTAVIHFGERGKE